MKKNIDFGIIQWFGGFNHKKNQINKGGMAKFIFSEKLSWTSIFNFKDDTKELFKDNYSSLKEKIIISFEEENETYIYLLKDSNCLNIFTDIELLSILEQLLEKEINRNILQNILIAVVNRNLDISYISKKAILAGNIYFFKKIVDIEFIEYFFSKKDYFSLVLLKKALVIEIVDLTFDFYLDEDTIWNEKITSIKDRLPEDNLIEFGEIYETIEIFRNINDPQFISKKFPFQPINIISNLKLVEDNSSVIIDYIKKNIKFKDFLSIKEFIEYINNYFCFEELENFFMDQILQMVYFNLKDTYSIKKFLNYFDGTIIFNNYKNNQLYDQLRKKLLEECSELKELIEDFLLQLPENKKRFYNIAFHSKQRTFWNREYYSTNSSIYNFVNKYMPNYISETYDFKNGKKLKEGFIHFKYVIDKKVLVDSFNYSIVNVPSTKFENDIKRFYVLIKLLCAFTGIKNGFNHIFVSSKKPLIPKKLKGEGIINNIECNVLKTKYAILIDDVFTSESTLKHCEFKIRMKNISIDIPYYITFSRTSNKIRVQHFFNYSSNKDFLLGELEIKYKYCSKSLEEIYFIEENIYGETKEIFKAIPFLKENLKERIPLKNRIYNNDYIFKLYSKDGKILTFNI